MPNKDFDSSRNPAAGTTPHGDPGKHAARPSSGPGARERDVIPPSTTGNAANDQNGSAGPRGKKGRRDDR